MWVVTRVKTLLSLCEHVYVFYVEQCMSKHPDVVWFCAICVYYYGVTLAEI